MSALIVLVAGYIDGLADVSLPEAEIVFAPEGQLPIDLAITKDPHVILLSELETCRQFKSHEALRHIPVVFATSAATSSETRAQALESGADAFLRQPIDPLEFAALVRSMARIHDSANITERGRHGEEREMMIRILRHLNSMSDLHGLIREVTGVLQEWSGCQAVGIRLQEGPDFPYFETRGFPAEFVRAENSLCARDLAGRLLSDDAGNPVLECMCGNIICGRFDPGKPFFTEDGSFWTNSTSKLLNSTTETDRQSRTRNRCNGEGYESVALVPLRAGGRTLGLLQFNDRRKDRFTPGKIAMLERAAASISVALEQRKTLEALRESEEKYRDLFDSAADAIIIHDAAGRILAANAATCERYGYTPDEVASLTIAALDTPEQGLLAPERIARIMKDGAMHFETMHRRKDGTQIAVDVNARLIAWTGQPAVMSICRDVTERDSAEKALTHSRDLMRYIIEHTRSSVAVLDRNLNYIYVSQRYLDEYRLKERDIAGKRHYEVFPEIPHAWRLVHQRALAGEVLSADNDFFLRADGSHDWIRWECRPWYTGDRAVGGIVLYTENITERKRAEETLRRSEQRQKAIIEAAMDGFVCLDLQGRLLEVNETYCRMTGYGKKELLAMSVADLEDAEGPGEVAAHLAKIVQCGDDRFETRHRRKDGSGFPVEITVQFKAGEPGQIVAFIKDVSQRKRAEAALLERNRYIDTILENAPIGFAVNRIHDGKGVFVGHKFEELYGVALGSLSSVDDYFEKVYLDPEFRERIRERMMSDMASGDPARMRWEDIPITTAAGQQRYVTAINIPIPDQNLMVSTVQDVTERKRAEEDSEKLRTQLIQAQKMESIGRLAGGVAHDFNNLLTVINGYSQLAMATLKANDPLRNHLIEIGKAGERAAGLTAQLLAFSRKQILQPQVLDLNRVVADMRSMLERLMGEDVEVRFALHPDSVTVRADPHQLEQVIMNLAVNARDAMPTGGRLLIETVLVERDQSYADAHAEAHAGCFAMLAVSDNGAGMDEATRHRVFEPFFTTKRAGKGTGLGLSMVHGIVAQSGGHINVYSEPGQGTTFKIYLPALAGAAAGPAKSSTIPALKGNETVLVVEDQAEVRHYAAAVLKAYGYRVIEAANAGEALMICEREKLRIHMVLTDVVMPHTSGRELASRLVAMRPGIHVLFMSGYTDNVIVHHGILDAGTHFIQKPFSPEELAGKVRSVLGSPAPPGRILVVDNDSGVRSFLRAALASGGYEVCEAAEGRQALRQLKAGKFDLVITDLVMPEQEGIEIIGALRRETPDIGVIAISGAFGGQLLETAQMLGADAVLLKPVTSEQLLATVREALTRRRSPGNP